MSLARTGDAAAGNSPHLQCTPTNSTGGHRRGPCGERTVTDEDRAASVSKGSRRFATSRQAQRCSGRTGPAHDPVPNTHAAITTRGVGAEGARPIAPLRWRRGVRSRPSAAQRAAPDAGALWGDPHTGSVADEDRMRCLRCRGSTPQAEQIGGGLARGFRQAPRRTRLTRRRTRAARGKKPESPRGIAASPQLGGDGQVTWRVCATASRIVGAESPQVGEKRGGGKRCEQCCMPTHAQAGSESTEDIGTLAGAGGKR